jgi:hypothetical protein
MIRNSFTKAAFIGTVIAAAFAGASFAQDGTVGGAWKIDSARFNKGWASISVERESAAANQGNGQFIVVDGGNVYLATGMAMSTATKVTDVAAAGGKLVLIGTNARRADFCSFKCQYGQPERTLTLRFLSLGAAEQLMGEMVAYNNR